MRLKIILIHQVTPSQNLVVRLEPLDHPVPPDKAGFLQGHLYQRVIESPPGSARERTLKSLKAAHVCFPTSFVPFFLSPHYYMFLSHFGLSPL